MGWPAYAAITPGFPLSIAESGRSLPSGYEKKTAPRSFPPSARGA